MSTQLPGVTITFKDGGTHVNLSGVLLAKNAPNKANGVKLIEWLAGDTAQKIYADMNYEYPLRAGVAIDPTIAGYGKLNPDTTPFSKIAVIVLMGGSEARGFPTGFPRERVEKPDGCFLLRA